jgi:hypothetical protein
MSINLKNIPIPNEKVRKNRMGIFVFRRKTPRRENTTFSGGKPPGGR